MKQHRLLLVAVLTAATALLIGDPAHVGTPQPR
jgi:hypothetical protein